MIEDVAAGQRLVIIAVLLNIGTYVVMAIVGDIGSLLAIAAIIVGIIGLLRLGTGLGYSMLTKVVLCILLFVPLIGLIMLLIVNTSATKQLREAGYKVGLLGASK